jgi:hypothetical protein
LLSKCSSLDKIDLSSLKNITTIWNNFLYKCSNL